MVHPLENVMPMFTLISLSLLWVAEILPSESVHQQLFSRTDAVPANSCHKIRRPAFNLNHCMQLCLQNFKSDMFSVNKFTDECMCCDFALSGTTQNATEWISFHQKCPDGYSEKRYKSVQTCLKFVTKPAFYHDASFDCQKVNGDLIRLNSNDKFHIFQEFLDCHATTDDIWVQGVKDSSSVFRFHDGTKIGDVCPINLLGVFENCLRYKISASGCWDFNSNGNFSYVCEYDVFP